MAKQNLMADECVRVSGDLDQVIADLQNGRSPLTRHGDLIDQVEALGMRLIAAARGPGRPVHAPSWVSPDGHSAIF